MVSQSNSNTEDKKVTPVSGNIKLIDFGVLDQPREIRIGSSLSPDERSGLIDSGHTWMYLHGRMRTCQALTPL